MEGTVAEYHVCRCDKPVEEGMMNIQQSHRALRRFRVRSIGEAYAGPLAASLLFMSFIWLTGRYTSWNWLAALLYAPARGYITGGILPCSIVVCSHCQFQNETLLGGCDTIDVIRFVACA